MKNKKKITPIDRSKWVVPRDNSRRKSRAEAFKGLFNKRKKGRIWEDEYMPFPCPNCGEKLRENIIRLRPDLFECRKCTHTFIKENVVDEFDFDEL